MQRIKNAPRVVLFPPVSGEFNMTEKADKYRVEQKTSMQTKKMMKNDKEELAKIARHE